MQNDISGISMQLVKSKEDALIRVYLINTLNFNICNDMIVYTNQ